MRKVLSGFCIELLIFLTAATAVNAEEREPLGTRITFQGLSTAMPIAPEIYYERADALAAQGKIFVYYLDTQEEMHQVCDQEDEHPPEHMYAGCVMWLAGICIIEIWTGRDIWYQRATARLHEWAHCGGWPEEHPGGGTVRREELRQCFIDPNCRPMFN